MSFELHPRLAADCHVLGDFPLCRLLLMNDSQYPWVILVPRRENLREVYQLGEADQQVLWRESARLSRVLMEIFAGDKLNIAALGNVVPQLHVHHVVRFISDAAWPGPVWGRVPPLDYEPAALEQRMRLICSRLGPDLVSPAPRI